MNISAFSIDHWRSLDRPAKAELLALGECLSTQRERPAIPDARGRVVWGAPFQFGCSPAPGLAALQDVAGLAEALALGACPFARDLEGDGPFEYSFRHLESLDPSDPLASLAHRVLGLCWDAGSELLDARSPLYVGDDDAALIRFDLALACLSLNGKAHAAAAGIPVDPSWLVPFEREEPWLRGAFLRWGTPDDVKGGLHAGLDLKSPVREDSTSPIDSLWFWLDDALSDAFERGLVLLAAGNDPREPVDGRVPLDELRDGDAPALAERMRAFLLARDELRALSDAVATPPSAPPRFGL